MSETKLTKWTKGPWTIDPKAVRDVQGDGFEICSSYAERNVDSLWRITGPCPPQEQAEANAHLIAAAPDLYEALASLLSGYTSAKANVAIAALAKARGEP